jgi:methylated-DNA-[protein]-cysteine S-methyltransferase
MTDQGFTLFDTAIGPCAIAWRSGRIVGVGLPERTPSHTRARMARRLPEAIEQAPPPAVQAVIDDVVALLNGEARDLSTVPLDLADVPDFNRRVYDVARTIPPGRTLTYGEIATRLGVPKEAREVGQALGRNPCPIVVPCHRVLAADGKSGGFSANGGVDTKMRMLSIERMHASEKGMPTLFDNDAAFGFQAAPRRSVPKTRR